jgi:hypothetical protein
MHRLGPADLAAGRGYNRTSFGQRAAESVYKSSFSSIPSRQYAVGSFDEIFGSTTINC